jgi:hypothetical protein
MPASEPSSLLFGRLAAEVWRLGRRIDAQPETHERIVDSYKRLVAALEDGGVRIDDPIGRRFVDGTNAEIIDLPNGSDPARDVLIVSDVLRPAVFVAGEAVIIPQVLLAYEQQSQEAGGDAEQH